MKDVIVGKEMGDKHEVTSVVVDQIVCLLGRQRRLLSLVWGRVVSRLRRCVENRIWHCILCQPLSIRPDRCILGSI